MTLINLFILIFDGPDVSKSLWLLAGLPKYDPRERLDGNFSSPYRVHNGPESTQPPVKLVSGLS